MLDAEQNANFDGVRDPLAQGGAEGAVSGIQLCNSDSMRMTSSSMRCIKPLLQMQCSGFA